MCDEHEHSHDHAAEIDVETIAREFHTIKHLLHDLNDTAKEIAESLRRIEKQKSV